MTLIDKFGLTAFYPTRLEACSLPWYMDSTTTNPNSDPRILRQGTSGFLVRGRDGSWTASDQSSVRITIATSDTTTGTPAYDHAVLRGRGYARNIRDWRNVEVTGRFYAESSNAKISISTRSTSHTSPGPDCGGHCYIASIFLGGGNAQWSKEQWHTYISNRDFASNAFIPHPNAWFGFKIIVYNKQRLSDGILGVVMESYVDQNDDNNWVLVSSEEDFGGWGTQGATCNGSSDQIISWGGPETSIFWNNTPDMGRIFFKDVSVREIDTTLVTPTADCPPGQRFDLALNRCVDVTGTGTTTTTTTSSISNDLDSFGIKKIYPTVIGGEEAYISMTAPNGGTRLDIGGSVTALLKNADDSWRCDNNEDVRLYLKTSADYDQSLVTQNHAEARQRGFLMSPYDWKNVEVTGFYYLDVRTPRSPEFGGVSEQISHAARTARHAAPQPWCSGCAYEANLLFNGAIRWAKEQWHISYVYQFPNGKFVNITQLDKRWVGFKMVVYNQVMDGMDHVHMEMYINDNGDKVTWRKLDADIMDSGGWGDTDAVCGGDPDQKITWGGPLAGVRWDGGHQINFKWLSAREIDPTGSNSEPPPPEGYVNIISKHRYNINVSEPGHCFEGP